MTRPESQARRTQAGPAHIARVCMALLEIERGWWDRKQLELRPVYHRKQERIFAHV